MSAMRKRLHARCAERPSYDAPECREIGQGPYCYVRGNNFDGSLLILRFQTIAEVNAAMVKGMELDHIHGAPPELLEALFAAAKAAAPS